MSDSEVIYHHIYFLLIKTNGILGYKNNLVQDDGLPSVLFIMDENVFLLLMSTIIFKKGLSALPMD